MKNNLIRFAAIAALSSTAAFAATQSYSVTLPNTFVPGPPPSGGQPLNFSSQNVTLPQWDPSTFGGSLISVQYRITSSAYATYNINNGNQQADFQVDLFNLNFTAAGPFGGSPTITLNNAAFGGGLSLSIPGVAANANVNSTTSAVTAGPSSYSTDSSNTASYVGTGTVTFTLGGSGVLAISGQATGSGSSVSFEQTASKFGTTTVEILYTYDPVPEPSTYAAIGFAGLVAGATIWRRRQAAKQA